ncbi:MAG TPA: integration host factor subunit alpha [Oligoflexia bacterium]|nr:integration host factor subunit alpha [Oligoflexia bacterium]HMP27551.1 integration host factor subunit alpha [Oligoflexia bacterium]
MKINTDFCLTKAYLIDRIVVELNIDKPRATEIVERCFEIMKSALETEGKLMISGFGRFQVKQKAERKGRNPQTNEPMMLRARKVLKFKASNLLIKRMNGETANAADDTNEEDS